MDRDGHRQQGRRSDALENLRVWRAACRLCVDVHEAAKDVPTEPTWWALRDQMLRSALSVPSNIAEGHERGFRRDFSRFLRIARGSCGELRTQLYIAAELGALERDVAQRLAARSLELTRMLNALLRHVQRARPPVPTPLHPAP